MASPLLTVLLALSAAVAWGSGDFSSGMAARQVGSFLTVLITYTVGLLALVLVALITHEAIPPASDLAWGALAGLAGMVGLGFLLRGFTNGQMGVVAPVSAVLATAIPVVFTALTHGLPRELQVAGFGLGLAGIWLLSRPEPLTGRPAGLTDALLAGLGFAGFFILLDQVSEGPVFWPLVAGRLAACGLMLGFALVTRRSLRPAHFPAGLLVLAGVLDVAGNLFFLLAIQTGRLDVAAVLVSFYPAVTATLAWLISQERMTRLQVIGVAAAILATVMITM